jgi:hypothetical protein
MIYMFWLMKEKNISLCISTLPVRISTFPGAKSRHGAPKKKKGPSQTNETTLSM